MWACAVCTYHNPSSPPNRPPPPPAGPNDDDDDDDRRGRDAVSNFFAPRRRRGAASTTTVTTEEEEEEVRCKMCRSVRRTTSSTTPHSASSSSSPAPNAVVDLTSPPHTSLSLSSGLSFTGGSTETARRKRRRRSRSTDRSCGRKDKGGMEDDPAIGKNPGEKGHDYERGARKVVSASTSECRSDDEDESENDDGDLGSPITGGSRDTAVALAEDRRRGGGAMGASASRSRPSSASSSGINRRRRHSSPQSTHLRRDSSASSSSVKDKEKKGASSASASASASSTTTTAASSKWRRPHTGGSSVATASTLMDSQKAAQTGGQRRRQTGGGVHHRGKDIIAIDDDDVEDSSDDDDRREDAKRPLSFSRDDRNRNNRHRCNGHDKRERPRPYVTGDGAPFRRETKNDGEEEGERHFEAGRGGRHGGRQRGDNRSTEERSEDNRARRPLRPTVEAAAVPAASSVAPSSTTSVPPSPASAAALNARAASLLTSTFRLPSLRGLQPQVVSLALRSKSQIVVMATGTGKSLCYQLPAATLDGLTVVVSPLVALMHDQVHNLNRKGLPAAVLTGSSGGKGKREENERVLKRLFRSGEKEKESQTNSDRRRGSERGGHDGGCSAAATNGNDAKPKLLYCTPELLETERFRSVLEKIHHGGRKSDKGSGGGGRERGLSMFAIDEAHCLSTWGHDFRPAYRRLGWIREAFPDVPCMACTATATPAVIRDIRDVLRLPERDAPCHLGSFNRANLSYEVRFKDSLDASKPQGALEDLLSVVRKFHSAARASGEPVSGIVYVHKRSDTNTIANAINKATGAAAAAYHAGLRDADRRETQRKWTNGTIQVAVATVAFGMGIDLPHVRYVLHWSMPKSVEGFYQESGRGGRDGKDSSSILYYSREDASLFAFLIKKNAGGKSRRTPAGDLNGSAAKENDRDLLALQAMVDYCTKPGCKRKFLLRHFGEDIDAERVCAGTCDYCKDPSGTELAIQASECMGVALSTTRMVKRTRERGSEWDGQWNGPHGESGQAGDDDGSDNSIEVDHDGLGITRSFSESVPVSNQRTKKGALDGFVKASSVLDKYEKLECQSGKKSGFVRLRLKNGGEPPKQVNPPAVPEHLRSSLPDPLQSFSKKSTKQSDSCNGSTEIANEIARLQAEKERLRERKAALLAKMRGSKK